MASATQDKLQELLNEFGVAMLITRDAEGCLHARPMALAEVESEGSLWFVTDRHSGKVDELSQDNHVAVTMQSSTKFLAVSGSATPVEDRERVTRLWSAAWKVWFPGGKDDPNLLLLRVDISTGEYWDNGLSGGLKYLIEAGKALWKGSRPAVEGDPRVHGKVNLAHKEVGAAERSGTVS